MNQEWDGKLIVENTTQTVTSQLLIALNDKCQSRFKLPGVKSRRAVKSGDLSLLLPLGQLSLSKGTKRQLTPLRTSMSEEQKCLKLSRVQTEASTHGDKS
jgi:hypothetical protein